MSEINSPRYSRVKKLFYLVGKRCNSCNKTYHSERNYCGDCGRGSELEEIRLPREGKVKASTVVRSPHSDLFMNKKIPYGFGLIDLDGIDISVEGLIDSEERITGEKVKARIGKLGENSRGLKIYSYIWGKKKEYSSPKPNNKGEYDGSGVGIEGYGAYVPKYRIRSEEISCVYGNEVKGLQKSVPGKFDDTGSYAMNSALNALEHAGIEGKEVDFIKVGSESHPYTVKPTSTIVGCLIGSHGWAADNEFACKAATQALFEAANAVEKDNLSFGLVIGADSAQARPGSQLEYQASDAGAAFILGKEKPIALLKDSSSYSSDLPDFWRNQGDEFPEAKGRFTGDPAYFRHIKKSASRLMEKQGLEPEDIDYFVPHQPNQKFPRRVARSLGLEDHVEPGIIVDSIGNPYAACSLLGLAKVLDEASPGELILLSSYGSGAGSDSFLFEVTNAIEEKRQRLERSIKSWLEEDVEYVSYGEYGKLKEILKD